MLSIAFIPLFFVFRKERLQTDRVRDTLVVFAHDDGQKGQERNDVKPPVLLAPSTTARSRREVRDEEVIGEIRASVHFEL